jgi:hypothetical protein
MTVPHRNDVAGLATLRPDHHHEPTIEVTRGDQAVFAVVEAVVADRCRRSGEHLGGALEVETPMLPRQIALDRIERDLNLMYPR